MSLVLIPVLIRAVRTNGEPVVGARVWARMTVDERDDGLVVPSGVDGETDSNGECTLNLWPNSRGVNGSQYRIVIDGGNAVYFSGLIVVPEAPPSAWPIPVDTLINQPPYPPRSVAENAQVAAAASAVEAKAARNEAVAATDGIAANAALAVASRDAAATSAATTAALSAAFTAVFGSHGYQVPVAYQAGLSMEVASQTVAYNGQTYAPILSTLPFTTSGVFEVAKFRLIQGVSGADLAAPSGPRLIGWQHSATAIPTNVDAALRRHFRVEDYIPGATPVAIAPVLCAVRNNGDRSDEFNHFRMINYSGHATIGMRNAAGAGKEVETAPGSLIFHHDAGAATVTLDGGLECDETLAQLYLRTGGSIGDKKSEFYFYRDIMAQITRSAAGVWNIGKENGVRGVAWDADNTRLIITHDQCPRAAILVSKNGSIDPGGWSIEPTQVDDYTTYLTFVRRAERHHSGRVEWKSSAEYGFTGNSQNLAIQGYNAATGDVTLIALGSAVPAVGMSSLTRSGAVGTMTTTSDHGLRVNDWIRIGGAGESQYNGWFQVKTVPSVTSVTFVLTGTPASPASGSPVYAAFRPGDIFAYTAAVTRYATALSPEIKALDTSLITINIRDLSGAVITAAPSAACRFVVDAVSRSQPELPTPGISIGLRWNSCSQIDPRGISLARDDARANFWFRARIGMQQA